MSSVSFLRLDTLAELRLAPVSNGAVILLVGRDLVTDNRGGFYRWNATSTSADDSASFMNVIASTRAGQTTGRWVRVFQRVRILPQGFLVMNGGVRTLYVQGVTDANGQVVINMTDDNTTTGTALFTEIWDSNAHIVSVETTATDSYALNSTTVGAGLKTLTVRFTRGNPTTLGANLTALLGLLITPFRYAPAGKTVSFTIVGV